MDGTYVVERVTLWDDLTTGSYDVVEECCNPHIIWHLNDIDIALCSEFETYFFRQIWVILQCCDNNVFYGGGYSFLVYYWRGTYIPQVVTRSFAALPGRPDFDSFGTVVADPMDNSAAPTSLVGGYCAECTATITIP